MTNEQIRDIALANGFKLKEQPDGRQDLNPYVYDFARALLDSNVVRNRKQPYVETWTDGYNDADEMGAEWRRQMDKDQ